MADEDGWASSTTVKVTLSALEHPVERLHVVRLKVNCPAGASPEGMTTWTDEAVDAQKPYVEL
jgi:hypothetical protein